MSSDSVAGRLRAFVRATLSEVYMSPKNVRGVGPEVDVDQTHGKLKPEEALVRFPEAINDLVSMIRDTYDMDELAMMTGSSRPYPGDAVKGVYNLFLRNGTLYAENKWDSELLAWDENDKFWYTGELDG